MMAKKLLLGIELLQQLKEWTRFLLEEFASGCIKLSSEMQSLEDIDKLCGNEESLLGIVLWGQELDQKGRDVVELGLAG